MSTYAMFFSIDTKKWSCLYEYILKVGYFTNNILTIYHITIQNVLYFENNNNNSIEKCSVEWNISTLIL